MCVTAAIHTPVSYYANAHVGRQYTIYKQYTDNNE